MVAELKAQKLSIYDVREYHSEKKVHFVVRMDGNKLKDAAQSEGGIDGAMRLKASINETNMVLFDADGKIHKYKTPKDIMLEFAKLRLKMYDVRKKYMINKLELEKELLGNRARFIAMIIAKETARQQSQEGRNCQRSHTPEVPEVWRHQSTKDRV